MSHDEDFNRKVEKLKADDWEVVFKFASWLRKHPRAVLYLVIGPAGSWVLWPMILGTDPRISREMVDIIQMASALGIPFLIDLLSGLLRPYADRRGNQRGGLTLGHTGITPEEAEKDNRREGR